MHTGRDKMRTHKQVKGRKQNNKNNFNRNVFMWLGIFLFLVYLFRVGSMAPQTPPKEMTYGEFYHLLLGNSESRAIVSAVKVEDRIKGVLSSGVQFTVDLPAGDQDLLRELKKNIPDFDVKPPKTLWFNLF